jgi:hypothetical protein
MESATMISKDPRQYVLLSMYHAENKDVDRAMRPLRAALKVNPRFESARRHLVSFLESEGEFEELNAVAREGTTYHPDVSLFWYHLGDTSIRLGNIEDGLAALRKCDPAKLTSYRRARLQELLDEHAGNGK